MSDTTRDELVERVARAMANAGSGFEREDWVPYVPIDDDEESSREHYVRMARAAIAAMPAPDDNWLDKTLLRRRKSRKETPVVSVKLTDTYEAWQYMGGEDVPDDVRSWLEHYHLSVISLERDQSYLTSMAKVKEMIQIDFESTQREPMAHIEWSINGSVFKCFPGQFVVFTEAGPVPFSAEDVEIVEDET